MNVYELFRAGYISTRVYNALAIGIMREKYRYKLMDADDYWVITCTIDELFEYYSEQELLMFRYIGPKAIKELLDARSVKSEDMIKYPDVIIKPEVTPREHFEPEPIQKVKYVGLRNYLLEHRISLTKLAQISGKSNLHTSLVGRYEPSKSVIDAILNVTGLTYEECFREETER